MENETQYFDSSTSSLLSSSEMLLQTHSSSETELDIGFTPAANESQMENATDEMIRSLDCGMFVMQYGIIAGVLCGIAFVIGVAFCLFGE